MLTRIEKKFDVDLPDYEVRFELDQQGTDVAQHDGIRWVLLLCPHCNSRTRFSPIHGAVEVAEIAPGEIQKDYHYLCQCEFCNGIVYAKFWEVDIDPDWHFAYETHYPTAALGRLDGVPQVVVASLAETVKCLNADASFATLVMCRRTIEAVLQDKGEADVGNLQRAIEKLTGNHVLHETMSHLADLVRLVGNIGAHAIEEKPDHKRAKETFDLTRQLVEILYVAPTRARGMKERLEEDKAARRGPTQTPQT